MKVNLVANLLKHNQKNMPTQVPVPQELVMRQQELKGLLTRSLEDLEQYTKEKMPIITESQADALVGMEQLAKNIKAVMNK